MNLVFQIHCSLMWSFAVSNYCAISFGVRDFKYIMEELSIGWVLKEAFAYSGNNKMLNTFTSLPLGSVWYLGYQSVRKHPSFLRFWTCLPTFRETIFDCRLSTHVSPHVAKFVDIFDKFRSWFGTDGTVQTFSMAEAWELSTSYDNHGTSKTIPETHGKGEKLHDRSLITSFIFHNLGS